MTELLKNAFRATVERHWRIHGMSSTKELAPVSVTISPPSSHLSIRVRDEGGGISPKDLPYVFSYAFTTVGRNGTMEDGMEGGPYAAQHVGGSAALGVGIDGEPDNVNLFGEITRKGVQTGVGTLAGLGYGLPMSRLYAK